MSNYPVLPTYEEATQPSYNPVFRHQDVFPRNFQQVPTGTFPRSFQQVPNAVPTAVTTHTTVIVTSSDFGPYAAHVQCPQCEQDIITMTTKKNGMFAWLLFIALLFFGFWCCCCMPFCVRSCKDVEHRCPNCKHLLGTYRRV